jgi:pyruvate formate lyase activating enzyme
MKEAFLYNKLDNNKVRCNLCAHRCVVNAGKDGQCPKCGLKIAGVGL